MDRETVDRGLDNLAELREQIENLGTIRGILDVMRMAAGADQRDEAEKLLGRAIAELRSAVGLVAGEVAEASTSDE